MWIGLMGVAVALATDVVVDLHGGGGLWTAADLLSARTNTPILFEGFPMDKPGLHLREGPVRPGGPIRDQVRTEPMDFQFRYPQEASPRQAAEAAVAAWNALPDTWAWYVVTEDRGLIHLVPTAVLSTDGDYVPYTPVLDTVLTLDRSTGTPTELYGRIVEGLRVATGLDIRDALTPPFGVGSAAEQRPITISSVASARDLLDQILRECPSETRVWWFSWLHTPAGGFSIGVRRIVPEDATRFDGEARPPVSPGVSFP